MITIAPAPPQPPSHRSGAVTAPIVSARGLTKSFPVRRSWSDLVLRPWERQKRTTVVDNVSFEVSRGELFGLVGANGAGKTTLFRMLASQLIPEGGTAAVGGCDVVGDPRGVRARLTPVGTDERSLNWRLTAAQNLELFAALYGVERATVAERIAALLRTVGLPSAGGKMVATFSSGMKQRLLIARALLAQPQVLLLDEPTRSLDPISARELRGFLRDEIVGRQRCTVLLATHSAEEAFELCDRVAVLERGRLLASGRVKDLMGEVSDDRYEAEVRDLHLGAAVQLLTSAGFDHEVMAEQNTMGWGGLRLRIPGGPEGAAELLSRLAAAGIHVSRFHRTELTLADLIERIVARQEKEGHA